MEVDNTAKKMMGPGAGLRGGGRTYLARSRFNTQNLEREVGPGKGPDTHRSERWANRDI